MTKKYSGLHIGCGDNYLPGWMNIDTNPDILPDLCADATNLPFRNNSFEQTCMSHVIEHIPYRTIPATLSGIYRVLKSGGILIIETPDIEGCFRDFLDAPQDRRRELLSFIFGLDVTGMKHQMLLPEKLLIIELEAAGFEVVEIGPGRSHLNNPGLRITARKKQSEIADFWSGFWLKIINSGMIDAINQLEMLEIRENVQKCLKKHVFDKRCLFSLMVMHPALVMWLIKLLPTRQNKSLDMDYIVPRYTKPVWAKQIEITYMLKLMQDKVRMDYDGFTDYFTQKISEDDDEFRIPSVAVLFDDFSPGKMSLILTEVSVFSRYKHDKFLRLTLTKGNRLLAQGDEKGALNAFKMASQGGLWIYADLNIACASGAGGQTDDAARMYMDIQKSLTGREEALRKEIDRRIELLKNNEPDNRPFNYGDFVWRMPDVCDTGTA